MRRSKKTTVEIPKSLNDLKDFAPIDKHLYRALCNSSVQKKVLILVNDLEEQ